VRGGLDGYEVKLTKRFEGDGRVEVYLLLLDVASEIEFIGFAVVVEFSF